MRMGGSLEFAQSNQVFPHYIVASNELSIAKILTCPAEVNRSCSDNFVSLIDSNLSYFVVLTAKESVPEAMLCGDRNLVGGDPEFAVLRSFTRDSVTSWNRELHHQKGNVGFVDGNASLTSAELQRIIRSNSLPIARLVIP